MQAKVKNAVMTTALVLVTIFVLRKIGPIKSVVDKALVG